MNVPAEKLVNTAMMIALDEILREGPCWPEGMRGSEAVFPYC